MDKGNTKANAVAKITALILAAILIVHGDGAVRPRTGREIHTANVTTQGGN
jgi:hypothetical protein